MIWDNFIKGLKKSFGGDDHLRELNKCSMCGKDSFFGTCLKCEVDEAFRGWERKQREK